MGLTGHGTIVDVVLIIALVIIVIVVIKYLIAPLLFLVPIGIDTSILPAMTATIHNGHLTPS